MMKHPYALDENGKLIHISELERDRITKEIAGKYRGKKFYNLDGNKEQGFTPVLLGKTKHFRIKTEGGVSLEFIEVANQIWKGINNFFT